MWPYRSNREDLVKTVVHTLQMHTDTHTHNVRETHEPTTPDTHCG